MNATYPKVIVSKNGYATVREFDTYGWRKRSGSGEVQSRRSRVPVTDGRRRYRVRMRAAARCNAFAEARWEMQKQCKPAVFGRGLAMTTAIDKAARGRSEHLRP